MKTHPHLTIGKLLIGLSIIISSCGNITEEIYLNEDGSGSYMMYTDMISSSRNMMLEMMQSIYPDLDEDSLNQVVEENLWSDFPSEVDSLIDISSQVPDSVKNNPEKMKILASMEMFMKGSRAEGFLNMGARFEFQNMDELEEFQNFLAENQDTGASPGTPDLDLPKMKVDYEFDGKVFSRKSTMIGESQNLPDSTLAVMAIMLGETKTKTIIHLPKNVKSASKNQLRDKNGKIVTYEYSLLETVKGSQSTDFKIELKK